MTINDTCKMLGIDRLTPDNTDMEDMDVWRSIRDDTTLIFQWESNSAQQYMKKFMSDTTLEKASSKIPNFSMLKWMSFGNGLIRPACASFRDSVANGEFYDNGFDALNEFLAPEAGRIAMQETIMKFLVKFCGYTNVESDNVRRCVHEDSLVLMGDGNSKPIKNIQVGDLVQSLNQFNQIEYKRVSKVFNNGKKQLYRIVTQHGYELKATAEHKILTQRGWVRVKDLLSDDYAFAPSKILSPSVDVSPVGIREIEQIEIGNVYDIEVTDNHNYIAEGIIVHNCIAKKKGTETLLPEIESRFISYCMQEYGMTYENCEAVIKPFIQIILDASAYGFSWNHSDAYSSIGYICGYLRYYHPLEFLTSALNTFGDNMDKTADIIAYASRVGIKVTPPRWGFSRGEYFFNKEKKVIAKGLASVKYMGAMLADELYELANEKEYKYFVDLLTDLDTHTSINSRQLDILIKLDFFSEFGNQRELLRIVDIFCNTFKKGEAKKLKKSEVDGSPIENIIYSHSTGTTKAGASAKSYTLTDVPAILRGVESAVKSAGMEDLSDLIKVRNFYDVMGYIGYTSGKEEDRPKLYITEVSPLRRKSDGKQFGYSVFTKSIGSGKENRFTVFSRVFDKEPLKEGDMIYCKRYQRDGKYFQMLDYYKII